MNSQSVQASDTCVVHRESVCAISGIVLVHREVLNFAVACATQLEGWGDLAAAGNTRERCHSAYCWKWMHIQAWMCMDVQWVSSPTWHASK